MCAEGASRRVGRGRLEQESEKRRESGSGTESPAASAGCNETFDPPPGEVPTLGLHGSRIDQTEQGFEVEEAVVNRDAEVLKIP